MTEKPCYQQTLFSQDYVCPAAKNHPRVKSRLGKAAFLREAHIVVSSSGTGRSIIDKVFAQHGIKREMALRLPGFPGVARIVAQTELLVIVPGSLGDMLASQESVMVLQPPVDLPSCAVKQHRHERFHADPANVWLRRIMSTLFSWPPSSHAFLWMDPAFAAYAKLSMQIISAGPRRN